MDFTGDQNDIGMINSGNLSENVSDVWFMPHRERLIASVFYVIVATFGTVGNLLVIMAIFFSRKLQTPTNAFVLSLGVADLLVSTMQPLQVVGLLSHTGWPLSDAVCELAGSIIVISVSSSVITLAMISVNRHCLITKSRRVYLSIYQAKNIFIMIFISWFLPVGVLIIPQALGYGQLGYDTYTHLCAWDFEHNLAKFYQIIAAMIGVISYSVILVSYSLIYLHLHKHSMSLQRHFKSQHQPNRIDRKVQVNVQITKNLFYVVCVYLVCVVPYSLCLLFISENNALARHASLYLALILVMNSCANVIIYGLKHPHFRVVFKCLITCRLNDVPMPSRLLKLMLTKSEDGQGNSAVPSDRPVNLTSDTWPSHFNNSSRKKRLPSVLSV